MDVHEQLSIIAKGLESVTDLGKWSGYLGKVIRWFHPYTEGWSDFQTHHEFEADGP